MVDLIETFTDNDSICYLMEYLPGNDLLWVLSNEMHLDLGKTKDKSWVKFYMAEVMYAITSLHAQNIIYRDIKPENIVVAADGHIKLVDFGFAKILGKSKSTGQYRTFTNCGTIGYTAPEVIFNGGQGFSF